jgi:hypothetical protein
METLLGVGSRVQVEELRMTDVPGADRSEQGLRVVSRGAEQVAAGVLLFLLGA